MRILLIECNPFMPCNTPISLGYLASFLKMHGYDARILCIGNDTFLSTHSLAALIHDFRPRLVGFAAYQRNIPYILGWARLVKSMVPECFVVFGGPQATFIPTDTLGKLDPVDFICRSEGEDTLLALAQSIEGHAPLVGLNGIVGRDLEGEGVWEGPRRDGREDLDEYPSPYLDGTLVPIAGKDAILLASRGCPFQCIFCYTPRAFGKKIRHHSVERVMEEIAWIQRQGADHFWFADPSFTFNHERVHTLLDSLLERGIRTSIWIETRTDLVNKELLEKLKRAGVHTIAYGLEAVSIEVLEHIRKPIQIEQFEETIRRTQEAGIEVELFSQYGLPGQTFEGALATLEFVKKNRVKVQGNTNAQQMQIYFGTEVCEHYREYGIRPLERQTFPYLSIGARYQTDWLSAEDIQRLDVLWKQSSMDGGNRVVS